MEINDKNLQQFIYFIESSGKIMKFVKMIGLLENAETSPG